MAADKPVSKGAAKNMLISFLLGCGSLVMVIGLFGAAAANGKWDDDNKWVNKQMGRQNDLHILALTIVVLALVSGVFLLLGGLVYCCAPAKHCCQIGLYTFAFFLWIGCLAAEVLGLDWSKYGDGRTNWGDGTSPIASYYDFHDNADFNKYVNTYTTAYPAAYKELYDQFTQILPGVFCQMFLADSSDTGKPAQALKGVTGGDTVLNDLKGQMSQWTDPTTAPLQCAQYISQQQSTAPIVQAAALVLLGLNLTEIGNLAPEVGMSFSDAVPKAINPILKLLYGLGQAEVLVQVPDNLDWSDYLQPYVKPGQTDLANVSPVALNWTAMILDKTLIGSDPCVYLFDNSVMLDSIGGWDAEDFKRVWCWNYRKQVYQENEWLAGGDRTEVDVYRRASTQKRDAMIYDSWWAFYMYNALFLGMQVTGFVVTIVAGFMHMCSLDRFGVAENDNKEKK